MTIKSFILTLSIFLTSSLFAAFSTSEKNTIPEQKEPDKNVVIHSKVIWENSSLPISWTANEENKDHTNRNGHQTEKENGKAPHFHEDGKHHHLHLDRLACRWRKLFFLYLFKLALIVSYIACLIFSFTHLSH